jgi:hypothetical protein
MIHSENYVNNYNSNMNCIYRKLTMRILRLKCHRSAVPREDMNYISSSAPTPVSSGFRNQLVVQRILKPAKRQKSKIQGGRLQTRILNSYSMQTSQHITFFRAVVFLLLCECAKVLYISILFCSFFSSFARFTWSNCTTDNVQNHLNSFCAMYFRVTPFSTQGIPETS